MRLSQINIYPIKSCAQRRIDGSLVEPRGLQYDRRFMLVDPQGRFMTQRVFPRMALIDVEISGEEVLARAPGREEPLRVPLSLKQGEPMEVTIWKDRVQATVADELSNQWFSEFLGRPTRLVYMPEDSVRPVRGDEAGEGDHVSFADSTPLLLISEASLAALNARLEKPVAMRRFRPNFVVAGTEPFEEDSWRRIAVGEAEFAVSWACTRCVLTTVDPVTGERSADREPLRTLKTFRQTEEGVIFGQNLIPRKLGAVRLDDEVRVLETA